MRKLIFLLGFLLLAISTKANDIYFTQSGVGTGASCSDPQSATYFNSPTNWGAAGSGKPIVPGTTLHLCGTFTGTPNQQMLLVKGSGTSGSPITIKFENGAILTAPYWSGSGAIYENGFSYITIDGGTNGLIQNTANGSSPTYANQQNSKAIYAPNCTGCIVKNLTIANMYVHNSTTDVAIDASQVACVYILGATNFTIDSVTCHDAGWAIPGSGTNFTLKNSNIYNVDHGMAFGASGTVTGLSVHDNHFHDFTNWDTGTTDRYHHDGIHLWGHLGNNVASGVIYNNLFDGDSGLNVTAFIYLEDSISNVIVFNNSIISPASRRMNGVWFAANSSTSPAATGNAAYNNYLVGGGDRTQNGALRVDSQANFTALNNIAIGAQSDLGMNFGTRSSSGINNNLYDDLFSDYGVTDVWNYNPGTGAKTFNMLSNWSSFCSCDLNSLAVTLANMKLSSTGVPQTGSPAIGLGVNLTNIATGTLAPLAKDKNGVARPTTNAWTVGAYQSQGTTSIDFGAGFSATGMAFNGSAALNGTHLRLTSGLQSQAGSGWFTTPVNVQTFTTDFTFQQINPNADGMTFAIQNSSVGAIGAAGGGLGYGTDPNYTQPGIPTSVAVKFDLFQNHGEGTNSTGLYTNGAPPTTPATTLGGGVNLHSGDVFKVHITYDGTTLTMTITDTLTNATFTTSWAINIPSTVGANTALVGFTGATGGQTATQDVITWTYNN